MRRTANLFDKICEIENLRAAFHQAARGKRGKLAVRRFSQYLDSEIGVISAQLRAETFEFGRFDQFLIRDPKERVITAPCFEERVVHHAIMNVCEPILDRWLIDDTFACRKGKGRDLALRRAHRFSGRYAYCLQLDVRKYFDSIDHERLVLLLHKCFKDRGLLTLFEQIIRSFRSELCVGVPIGSLTSQHFANFYLGWLDRFVKERLRLRGYIRYMDDMLLWHDNRNFLKSIHRDTSEFVGSMLKLELKPSRVMATRQGIEFLGCRVFPTHIELNRRSKRRWSRRVRYLERAYRFGQISDLELQQRLTALTAFVRSAEVKSWRFRSGVLKRLAVNDP